MRRVLVTGGSGLLGSDVARVAARRYDVTATYHSRPVSLPGIECHQVDLRDPDQYDTFVGDDLDAIVHCAALTDVDKCEREPDVARTHNVAMTDHLLEVAADMDARFIYISTDAVFDGEEGFYTESSDPNPINVYGETKRTAERCVLSRPVDAVVVRTNIYGWNVTDGKSLAEWVLDRLRNDRPVPAFTDAYMTPIYTDHLAECILELLKQEETGLLHIAGKERCSKYEFAKAVADVFDLKRSLVRRSSMADHDFDAPRGRDLSLSVQRAGDWLNCTLPDLQTGLERMRQEEP